MTNSLRRVGIMGGTFDPIHIGHLVAASEAAAQLDLDRVVFVPAGRPWQKQDREIAGAQDRCTMVERAIGANPQFTVSHVDVERPGPSYSVDTVRDLQQHYGAACELFFIVGSDAAAGIGTWHEPEELLRLAQLVQVTRPAPSDFQPTPAPPWGATGDGTAAGRVRSISIPALDISSRDIRGRVAHGRAFRYLVPERVFDFIIERGLYREGLFTGEHRGMS